MVASYAPQARYSPPAKSQRPTWDNIRLMREQRQRALQAMHDAMREADDLSHSDDRNSPIVSRLQEYIDFPKGFKYDIINYPYIVANRATNTVHTAEVPAVTYELDPFDKEDHPEWADHEKKVQIALQGIVYRIVAAATKSPALNQLQQQIGKGLGVITYARDYDAMPTKPDHGRTTPEEKEAWANYDRAVRNCLPWRVDVVHPTHVLFDLNNDPPRDYIIHKPVSRVDMARRFPQLGWDPNSISDDTITATSNLGQYATDRGPAGATCYYTEYCSADWYGCAVNDIPVTEGAGPDTEEGGDVIDGIAPNYTGHTWVQMAWSGLGDMDARGAWEHWGKGVIQRGMPLFDGLWFNRNYLKLLKLGHIPKLIATGDANMGGREQAITETEDLNPNKPQVAALSSAVNLHWLESPNVPQALMADIANQEHEIESMFGPAVLGGANTESGEPASKYAARTQAARGPYRAAKANIEQAWSLMLDDMLWDIKTEPDLSGGYYVSYTEGEGQNRTRFSSTLTPDIIHPGGRITLDFSPPTPQDKAFETEDALTKQKAGIQSVESTMQAIGVQDRKKERTEILFDMYLQSGKWMDIIDAMVKSTAPSRYNLNGQQGQPPGAGMPGAGGPGIPGSTGGGVVPPGAPPPVAGATNAPMPPQMQPNLPPNVPQQPGPLPGSQQEAAAQAAQFYPSGPNAALSAPPRNGIGA